MKTVIFGALLALAAAKVDYTGHKVIRVIPQTKEQVEFLQRWDSSGSVDFWTDPAKINSFSDIHVTPETFDKVSKILSDLNMKHQIQIADIGELQRQEEQNIALRRALYNGKAIDLENYHTYEEIMAYLDDLAATNSLVSTKVGGTTLEGRDIVQVTISSDPSAGRPVNFFDCNIHAREWIAGATCIWIIDQLSSNYGTDPEITALVDRFDWKIIPITNPDGYTFTWSDDRLWRKNRNPNPGANCIGVDANRNFPAGFAGSGASPLPCSDTYHGTEAFSEKESSTVRDLITADSGKVKTALSIHSYSQLWLSAYGYKTGFPTEYLNEMLPAMQVGVEAIQATYGTQYTYGTTANVLYIASGASTDYYYENAGVVQSYTIELRDTGRFGFVLPAAQIVPTATETWNGIKAMVNSI